MWRRLLRVRHAFDLAGGCVDGRLIWCVVIVRRVVEARRLTLNGPVPNMASASRPQQPAPENEKPIHSIDPAAIRKRNAGAKPSFWAKLKCW